MLCLADIYLKFFVEPSSKPEDEFMVPTRTGKQGKPGKMGRHFPVKEKSGNFVKTGKVREKSRNFTQNTGKNGKNYTGKLKRILEKSGKFVSQ